MQVYNSSWWEQKYIFNSIDFLIVGSGFTGQYLAYLLREKHPSAKICMVDRAPFSAGASTRNAGFATFGNVTEIYDDLQNMPQEEVWQLVEDRYRGLEWIKQSFGPEVFDYQNTGGWEIFTETNHDISSLAKEYNQELKHRIGLKETFQIKDTHDLGFKANHLGVFNPFEGQLNPAKLFLHLHSLNQKRGVLFFGGMEIEKIEGGNLLSKQGFELKASQIILATNAFTSTLFPEYAHTIVPARGQVLVTKELEKPLIPGIYHSDLGYIYFRSLGNRLLIGGGRNKFKEEETTWEIKSNENTLNYLLEYTKSVICPTQNVEIECSWSGIMAMGSGKFPIVERINSNTLVCARMGGIGVALTPIAAQKAVALL
jgi:gamma-glutamylputrescine oxidase